MRLSRRSLIHGLLLILGVDPAHCWRAGRRACEVAAQPVTSDHPPTVALSDSDIDDLAAFVEILVADMGPSPMMRRYLGEHLADRIKQAPDHYLPLYRTTVALLDRVAGGPFSRLDAAQRLELVTRHRLGSSLVLPDEELGTSPDEARTVRTQVVPDLIAGYFRSPAGWAVVGYDAFPGRCSDLSRYTGPGA